MMTNSDEVSMSSSTCTPCKTGALAELGIERMRQESGVEPALREQRQRVVALRAAYAERYRPLVIQGAAPIRVMARMVLELEQECRARRFAEVVISSEIVNRTIGDVDLRRVVEREGDIDYSLLADEVGVALPGEVINGRPASGATYLWLREQMMAAERLLLENGFDVRIYDVSGVGNPVLRRWLSDDLAEQWGIVLPPQQLFLSIGAMDGVHKTLLGLQQVLRLGRDGQVAILFPAPGFNVPEWQAVALGYRLHRVQTRPEDCFKLTPEQVAHELTKYPDIGAIYLTLSNNPTAFAYSEPELRALAQVAQSSGRRILLLADIAYIGTGDPEEDRARMRAFASPAILRDTIFIGSFSKMGTLTGERFGWVATGDPEIAQALTSGWMNSTASLPGEWQLRYMAYFQLFHQRPWLLTKIRRLYALRRTRLIAQLQKLNDEHNLFAEVYLDDRATVYNWSRLQASQDVFSLFERTGIAGVPGSAFGYSDDYVRLSVGVIPVPEIGSELTR
jgi:aspartate/methionine/tyrosine aminotransferase